MPSQPMVPMTANQITVTVGGNDIGFAEIALTCAPDPSSAACQAALAGVTASLGGLASSLPQVIAGVAAATGAVYVDVTDDFAGHGLCGTLSYINPPIPDGSGGFLDASLHPNDAGQAAYAQALLDEGFVGR